MGCTIEIFQDGSDHLWEEAYRRGENHVFVARVGSHNQRVVWVSTTGYPQHVAREAAQWRGLQILGRDAYVVDTDTEYLHGSYRVDILMTAP